MTEQKKIQPGYFSYTLKTPKELDGKEYNELHFNFAQVTGAMFLRIHREMLSLGIPMGDTAAESLEFVSKLAARCAGVSSDVIAGLDYADWNAIIARTQRFLVSGE